MKNENIIYVGVQIVSKILNFPIPELYIIEGDKLPNKDITGMYSFRNNEIIFNEDWVDRSEWIEVLITVFHEMRHAYQGYCVKTGTKETQETLEVWSHEITNYVMPSGTNKEEDDQSYLNQEIEIDAISFAHWLTKKELNIETIIPNIIKTEVAERISILNSTMDNTIKSIS